MMIDKRFSRISSSAPPRPFLKISVTNPHIGQSIDVLGLIDTGADECAFPGDQGMSKSK